MAYALARVARAQGVGMMALAREGDLADILYAHHWLEEVERIEGLERESEAIHNGFRLNWAFAAPKELQRERREFNSRLWAGQGGLTDTEKARVAQIVASLINTPTVVS